MKDFMQNVAVVMLDGMMSILFLWQVGLVLNGLQITDIVVGGPAYTCKQLDRGDLILKVDGKDVTLQGSRDALIGCDLPGSSVTITVQKGSGPHQVLMSMFAGRDQRPTSATCMHGTRKREGTK
jgi:C-terminal processing protease CtpA/Prc